MIQSSPAREHVARRSAAAPSLGLVARRVPWVSALGAAWLGIVFRLDLPLSDVLYAVWALPMIGWLSRRALRSGPLLALARPLPAT